MTNTIFQVSITVLCSWLQKSRMLSSKGPYWIRDHPFSIISLSVLGAAEVQRENTMRKPIEVSDFGGVPIYKMGFVTLN